MKIFKRILFSLLVAIDLFVLVVFIGYIKWGIDMPNTLAGRDMVFMGAYLLAIAYFVIFALITTTILIIVLKWRKHGRKNKLK